jgi:hypothetical protein
MAVIIRFRLAALFLVFVTITAACNYPSQALSTSQNVTPTATAPAAVSPTQPAVATATLVPPTQPAATTQAPTLVPTFTPTVQPTLTPTATPIPQCTILKDLSLFPGPGTAYLLQLAIIRAGTVVTPTGYNPAGYPSANWVQVTDPTSKQQGWIIATADYINCNLDLSTLPAVTVAPPEPGCRSLVNVVLRTGPGTAYWNNLVSVPFNTILTPSYYYPDGIPGGSWAYVKEPISQKKGWVDTSKSSIECNFDVSTLPSTTIDPPPYPHPTVSSVTSDCMGGKNGKIYDCSVVISDAYLLEVKVLKDGKEISFPNGANVVTFAVKDMVDNSTYNYKSSDEPYCIFSESNGKCYPWTLSGYTYKWPNYGTPLNTAHSFKILIRIQTSAPSLVLSWEGVFNFNVP